MPLRIVEVQARSQAAKAGINSQDTILSINGMLIDDFFDLQYYANDYRLEFELADASGATRAAVVERQPNKALGIEPEAYKHKSCRNNCVFCFIDQMPSGLRPSLYMKDDDYLFSYAFGNYITLTNLGQRELKRIIDQHISPLFISLHSTDTALRQAMMRNSGDTDILKILAKLSGHGISFHIQLVCVPGYNCGEELRRTLHSLSDSSADLLSIGVVPVGLTRYRAKLTKLQPFDKHLAKETLDIIDQLRSRSNIIQAADELFVLAGEPIPDLDYYGDFPQLENGIGMLRLMLANFQKRKRSLIRDLDKAGAAYLMLTSRSAFSTMESIAMSLGSKLTQARIRVQHLRNDFFGEHINVSGLLTASDIIAQAQAAPDETVILSSNVFNSDGLTLDGISQIELKTRLNRPLIVMDQLIEDWDWI